MKKMALILVTVFCLVAANKTMAQVVKQGTTGACTWTLTVDFSNDTILTISGSGAIPNYYYNSNCPWSSYKNNIKIVDIQQGVTGIGLNAFKDCRNLISVTIPNSVTIIGESAFGGCSSLISSLIIPDSVTTIERAAFYGCSSLTNVTIGNSVTTIEMEVFKFCSNLTTVNFKARNCTSMRDDVWENCSSFTILNIWDSVQTIPNYAFYSCSGLTSVTIPNSVTSIGNYAFYNCSGLTGTLTIPNSVTSIGNHAFRGCSSLTGALTIPNSVTSIGNYAFENCSGLTSVIIGDSVTTIGNSAFYGCSSLTSVTIGNSVTSIGSYTFYGCSNLISVTIGNSVATIVSTAFQNCSNITNLYIKAQTPPSTGDGFCQLYALSDVKTTVLVHVPCGSRTAYIHADCWRKFSYIIEDSPLSISLQSNDSIMGCATITQTNTCTNDTAIISATANTGYRFVQWQDGNTQNPRTITVTSDTVFTAEFISDGQNLYHVTVSSNNATMGIVTGAGNYAENDTVTITAIPNTGYRFVQWNDGNTQNPRTITIVSDTVFIAVFAEKKIVTQASIKNLEPNINPLVYTVRELATVYRYYKIVDSTGDPVYNAKINYSVGNHTFESYPSDMEGIVTIAFPVFGIDAENPNDDYVKPADNFVNMNFLSLKDEFDKELEIIGNNAFTQVQIKVLPYFSDDMYYGFNLGGNTGFGMKLFSQKINAGYTLTLGRLFNEFYEQTGWDVQSDLKGEYSASVSTSGDLPVFPFLSISGSIALGGGFKCKKTTKHTLPYTTGSFSDYTMIIFDILTGIWNMSEFGDENIHLLLNVLSTQLGMGNESMEYVESNKSGFIKTEIDGEAELNFGNAATFGLDVGVNSTIGLSVGNALKYNGATQEELLVKKTNLSTNIGIDIEGTFEDRKAKRNFGLTVGGSLSGGVGISTEQPRYLTALNKGSVSISYGWEVSISPSWGVSYEDADSLVYSQIQSISGKLSKDYKSTLTIKKSVFDLADRMQINDPLWGYFTNKTTNMGIMFGAAFGNHLQTIADGLANLNVSNAQPNLNDAVKWSADKEYTVNGNYSYSKSINLLGWKFNIGWNGGIFSQCSYPLSESYYHFGVKKTLMTVQYEDIDRFRDITAPVQPLTEHINNWIDKLYELDEFIRDQCEWYNQYVEKTERALSHLYLFWWDLTGRKSLSGTARRNYSPGLKNYKQLQRKAQTNICNLMIDIPCANEEVFFDNTEVHFNYYYPGGEVMGATTTQDTFIVISDIGFFSAYYGGDTLNVAPNGSYKVLGTTGNDDFDFLEIPYTYPVSIYHKPFTDSLWHNIGQPNDTLYVNTLGKFCLGISVNGDKEAPKININKSDSSRRVNITVTDNMAVAWKRVFVLINGLVTEYTRNGNTLYVDLQDNQLNDEVYVTVYAFDLANNESELSAEFGKTQLPEDPGTEDDIETYKQEIEYCKLYPNPATNSCRLFVSKDLLNDSPVRYAIISPLGQLYQTGMINDEETIINLEQLSSGIYFIAIYTDNKIISNQKLVINK